MNWDLEYNGKQLTWYRGRRANKLVFKATSGLPDHQTPVDQCLKNKGPIPEGKYHLWLDVAKKPAKDDGTGICRLIRDNSASN